MEYDDGETHLHVELVRDTKDSFKIDKEINSVHRAQRAVPPPFQGTTAPSTVPQYCEVLKENNIINNNSSDDDNNCNNNVNPFNAENARNYGLNVLKMATQKTQGSKIVNGGADDAGSRCPSVLSKKREKRVRGNDEEFFSSKEEGSNYGVAEDGSVMSEATEVEENVDPTKVVNMFEKKV